VKQELTSPIKQVALAGIGVGSEFVFIGGWYELPIFFFHFAKQIVEFGGVLKFQKQLDLQTGVGQTPRGKIRERQIIAIVVGGGIDVLGTLKIRHSIGDFLGLNVELAKVVIGVKILRLELDGPLELLSGTLKLSQADEIRGEIGPRGGRTGVQPHGFLKMGAGSCVLGLSGINQPQKLVNFKAFWDLLDQALQLYGGFSVMPGVILSDSRVEFMFEALILMGTGRRHERTRHEK
jgi:hypothetical protein